MSNRVFNPGDMNYKFTVNNPNFIDKTDLIYEVNKRVNIDNRYICVTRPRRFGKTVTANMLSAYYSYSEEKTTIFNDKNIAKKYEKLNKTEESNNSNDETNETDKKKENKIEKRNKADEKTKILKYLNEFNVIQLTMNDYFSKDTIDNGIKKLKNDIIKNVKMTIKNLKYSFDEEIYDLFSEIFTITKRQIVFIIDEWDVVIRKKKDDLKSIEEYLDFLNIFLKDKNYIALVYMTGILPLKKIGFSSLNNFIELTMVDPSWMAKYIGFTDEEVQKLCEKFIKNQNENSKKQKKNDGMAIVKDSTNNNIQSFNDKDDLIHKNKFENSNEKEFNPREISYDNMKKWYNGYKIVDDENNSVSIYTPFSVINALDNKKIRNYWNKSSSFEYLSSYIHMNYDGLKDDIILLMKKGTIKINVKTYQNDMTSFKCKDDVFTLLVHLGYLCYDENNNEVSVPNNEILEEFEICTNSKDWSDLFRDFQRSKEILKATLQYKTDKVAELVEEAHDEADKKTYNNETALKYAIKLAYYAARINYTILDEVDSGKGYADVIYIPKQTCNDSAFIVELKYMNSSESGMNQIIERNYSSRLVHYKDNLLLVAINYDKETKNKKHTCTIRKYDKNMKI